jgi:hypothetical protein
MRTVFFDTIRCLERSTEPAAQAARGKIPSEQKSNKNVDFNIHSAVRWIFLLAEGKE